MSAGPETMARSVPNPRRSSRVQSVARAAALLRAIATAPGSQATVARLADTCALNRATAWRILHTLEADRLVAHDRASGLFSIGTGLLDLARPAGPDGLLRAAQPVLARLAMQTGETAALAVVRPDGLVYVEEAVPSAIVSATWRSRRVPLHATSTGKALLAFSEHSAVAWMIESPLTAYTTSTITDPHELEDELRRTRTRGYGVCRGEYEESAFGVSAPVFDLTGEPFAVVSIWGPEGRVSDARFDALGVLAVEAARTLSAV